MTSGSFRSVSRPRNRRKSQSARLRLLASQSEVALDRSETFLRNQDPQRTRGSLGFAERQLWHIRLSFRLDVSGPDQLGSLSWQLGD